MWTDSSTARVLLLKTHVHQTQRRHGVPNRVDIVQVVRNDHYERKHFLYNKMIMVIFINNGIDFITLFSMIARDLSVFSDIPIIYFDDM